MIIRLFLIGVLKGLLFACVLAALFGLFAFLHQTLSEGVFIFTIIAAILGFCFGVAEIAPLRSPKNDRQAP